MTPSIELGGTFKVTFELAGFRAPTSGKFRTNVSAPRKPTTGTTGTSGIQDPIKKISRNFQENSEQNLQQNLLEIRWIAALESYKNQENEAIKSGKLAEGQSLT